MFNRLFETDGSLVLGRRYYSLIVGVEIAFLLPSNGDGLLSLDRLKEIVVMHVELW